MICKLNNKKLREWRQSQYDYFDFDNKYMSFLINRINEQYVRANKPKVVGSCKNLIREYFEEAGRSKCYEGYVDYYMSKNPNGIKMATKMLYDKFHKDSELKTLIKVKHFTREVLYNWVYELVLPNTYYGFMFQDLIIEDIGKRFNMIYRVATPEEDAEGIDGWVADIPIQVKPGTARGRSFLTPVGGFMVYYDKCNGGISYEIDKKFERVLTRKQKGD